MDDIKSEAIQKRDEQIAKWCNANGDVIDALMESKELLHETRQLIYRAKGILKDGRVG